LAYAQAQYDRAAELLKAGRRSFEEAGDGGEGLAWVLSHGGRVARARGATLEALNQFCESLALFHKLGELWGVAECFDLLAGCLCDLRQFEGTVQLIGSAASLRAQLAISPPGGDRAQRELDQTATRNALGAARFDAIRAQWERAPLDQAIVNAVTLVSCSSGEPPSAQ
jgi:hypothetical protein